MKNNEIAYAEVDTILSLMNEKYVNRIPNKLREIFKNGKSTDYRPNIESKKSLAEQNLQRETLVILATLCLNYWCDSEEEKQQFIKDYSENDKKNEDEIRAKYNPDNIFKRKDNIQESTQLLIKYKENALKKLWDKIKFLFTRGKK